MVKVVNDKRLITKVCTMHYIDNMSQKQIAEALGLSRPTISRMIANGRKLGIVEIKINNTVASEFVSLESELEEKLGLKEVIIVPEDDDIRQQQTLLAQAASELLERLIGENSTVGVDSGPVLAEIAEHLGTTTLKNSTFIPLIGGAGPVKFQSNAIAEDLAAQYTGKSLSLYAPGRVKNQEIQEVLLQETNVRRVLSKAREMDIALLNIERLDSASSLYQSGYFTAKDIKEIEERGGIGGLCFQVFDRNGSTGRFREFNTTIGLNIHRLRRTAHTIGIINGEKDVPAAIGAARGGYCNILILDERSAYTLLAETESKRKRKSTRGTN